MVHFFLFTDKWVTILQQTFSGSTFAGSQDDVRIGQVRDGVGSLKWHASGNTSWYELKVDWKSQRAHKSQNAKREREMGCSCLAFAEGRLGIYTSSLSP